MPFSTIPSAGFSRSATPTSSEVYAGVAVVVPARDEAREIGSLVRALVARSAHVLVVDDGSRDGTAAVAERAGAEVLRRPTSRGKGAALRSGLLWARSRPVQWIALIDGDNQHAVEDLDRLVA